jgi:transposase-like protein
MLTFEFIVLYNTRRGRWAQQEYAELKLKLLGASIRKNQNVQIYSSIECPYCHSDALYRYGFAPDGKQSYLCLICERQFVAVSQKRRPLADRPTCPVCNHPMYSYKLENQFERFRCSNYPQCRSYVKQWNKDVADQRAG